MDTLIEVVEYKDHHIEIHRDHNKPDPTKEFDSLGTMVCFHRKYNLGHEHNFDPEKAKEFIEYRGDEIVWLPLYLLDHGKISIKTFKFKDEWDSGQIGFIWADIDSFNEKGGYDWDEWTEERRGTAKKWLREEVEQYDQYLTGEVYGYIIQEGQEDTWGYYGDDHEKSGLLHDAKNLIDVAIKMHPEPHYKIRNKFMQDCRDDSVDSFDKAFEYIKKGLINMSINGTLPSDMNELDLNTILDEPNWEEKK